VISGYTFALTICFKGVLMKLNQWTKIIVTASCVVMLASCSSHKKPDQSAINAANASYRNGAEASGLGNGSGYGEESTGRKHLSSKKVYYFDYDSNVVHDDDKPALADNASYLLAHPNTKVMVEGHTDPRGSREYNVGLGERRARSIAANFTGKGVKPSQLALVSYGAEKPAAPGRTESDFQQDRRVVLVHTNQ
jgi:peptidoglycan-associated lipoprotein